MKWFARWMGLSVDAASLLVYLTVVLVVICVGLVLAGVIPDA